MRHLDVTYVLSLLARYMFYVLGAWDTAGYSGDTAVPCTRTRIPAVRTSPE